MARSIPWRMIGTAVAAGGVVGLIAKAAFGSAPTLSRSTTLSVLRPEYAAMYDAAQIRPERLASVDRVVTELVSHRDRYEAMSARTGVPWYVIAVLHAMEGGGSNGDFSKHLHNGDPLSSRTVHVPVGKPEVPPANGVAYTWEESAADALARFNGWHDWSLPATLWLLERYNGFGTRGHGVPTPYLWSFTDRYERGKYTHDGPSGWNPDAISQQAGAAALLKRMEQRGIISVPR